MIAAVIDLGSNTFHLLISKLEEGNPNTIYRERVFVGLSEGGINKIKEERIAIGLNTCQRFKEIIEGYSVDQIKVVGTAVLRTAENRMDFINPCNLIFGVPVEVINGKREAELIYKGVQLLKIKEQPYLIMDIGGGSVEYILVNQDKMVWLASFQIGVGILHALFHNTEPINEESIGELKAFVKTKLAPLQDAIHNYDINAIVGASGSFEVIKSINGYPDEINEFEVQDILNLSKRLKSMNLEERLLVEGLPEKRAKLIVVAMLLIELTIELANPNILLFSPFALKEGILNELVNE